MRKLIYKTILLLLIFAGTASAGYIINPYTSKFDAIQTISNGVTQYPVQCKTLVFTTVTDNADGSCNVSSMGAGVVDGSGTASYIPKWSDSDSLTDSIIREFGSNIGIGSTNPTQKLDVSGKIHASTDVIIGSNSVCQSDGTNCPTQTPVGWTDGGTNVYVTTLTDNVGIGTSQPTYKLDVNGDINIFSGKKYKINGTDLAATDVGAEPTLTKGNLTAVSPLSFDNTRQVIGGAAAVSIANGAADGATKGAVGFNSSDFDTTSGIASLDYTNAQSASGSLKGFLTAADWTTFNNKQSGPLTGDVTTSGAAATLSSSYKGWTDGGTNVYVTTTTDNVGIGTTQPTSKFFVDGDSDIVQAQIQGHSTQNADIFVVEKSDGTDILTVDNANVGIGTVNPTQKLEVVGTILGTNGTISSSGLLTIPNGSNPTVSAAGQISVDSSATSGSMLRFYGDASYQLPGYHSKTIVINGTTSASDSGVWRTPWAITIRAVHVLAIGGTNVVGHLDVCNSNGASCAGVDGATDITATTGTSANDDGSLSAATAAANSYIGWHTTSVSGTNTRTLITFEYTVDAVN